ncbi:MAG: PQQ-dependent sugar dehydrogenase [Chthoniobacteraceae bacterium]
MIRLLLALLVAGACPILAQAQTRSVDDYRRHALTREGNPERGRAIFHGEQRALCSKCHSIDGSASKAGPDLYAAGDAFGRRDLVDSVLEPSKRIAPGYGTVIVETTEGKMHQGVLKQANDAHTQLMGADGKLVTIPAAELKEKTGSTTSLMPEGLHAALSREEFTDLIEFLTTLRAPEHLQASHHGAPAKIAELERPIGIRPFLKTRFSLPRERVETGLASFRQIPGSAASFLVLHQKGIIWRITRTEGGEEKSVFADLALQVFSERGPNGLLDVAFHPDFLKNRKYYLFYQVFEEGTVTTHIVEKKFAPDLASDSGEPGRIILRIASVAEDHSGGCLDFGPDGFLYLVMGDTGPHHDPNGHAQNLGLLLGKVLRIDVDHPANGAEYSIPVDNPFRDRAGARPEIWAYGLRNPWRFCFDRLTKELWVADVGQDRVEEVAIVRRGENHGWNVYEGFERFSNEYRREGEKYVPPLFAYGHKYGNSITGGHVYRGNKQSSFYGAYICGDFNSKRIFALTQEGGVLKLVRQIGLLPERLVSFCEDAAGNIYAVGYEGTIYQLDFTETVFK